MNDLELNKIYPSGKMMTVPNSQTDNYLSLPLDGQWFIIPKDKISPTEIKLLEQLFLSNRLVANNLQENSWYKFLFKQEKSPVLTGDFRIIQFKIQGLDSKFLIDEWLNTLSSMFQDTADSFFLTETDGLLIEAKHKTPFSLKELEGIFLTLDTDFFCKTKAFIGHFMPISTAFPQLFLEEQEVFQAEVPFTKSKTVFSLPQIALQHFTKEALNKSLIAQSFRETNALNTEIKEIILALWNNQGNISSAAKDLFMHRNTLQYRIEKFYEQTGFSLKSMDDLILCYLLMN